jgi:hypothetical protein
VSLEFYYRFQYAFFALGEIGPLAVGILPGFRSGAVVLKTLLPESTMVGWFITFGPLLYVPFLAMGLLMMVQVFSDNWFTASAGCYVLAGVAQLYYSVKVSETYIDARSFLKKLESRNILSYVFMLLSVVCFAAFIYFTSAKTESGAAATFSGIGFSGYLSFAVRVIFNLQLTAVFTADSLIYVLRTVQKESRRDQDANMEYEKALEEFAVLEPEEKKGKQPSLRHAATVDPMLTAGAGSIAGASIDQAAGIELSSVKR